jgi:hypothetical protein
MVGVPSGLMDKGLTCETNGAVGLELELELELEMGEGGL